MANVKYLTQKDYERTQALSEEIEILEEEIEECRSRAERITQQLSDMPRGGGTSDKIAESAISTIALEETLRDIIAELDEERIKLIRRISLVPNSEDRILLTCRFVRGMTIQETADRMNTSYSAVQSRQRNFFRKLKKMKLVDPYGAYEKER